MLKAKSVLAGLLAAAVLATPFYALAQSTAGTTTPTPTTTKKKKVPTKKAPSHVEEELEELKHAVEQQNQQIQGLQQQVQQRDATIQQLQQSVSQAQSTATQAQQAAQSAQQDQQQKLQAVQTDLSDVKTMQTNSMTTLQETQKRIVDMENPTAIHYKGVTITPGGFLVGETLWRQHNESADIISSFNGIPFDGSVNSQLSEFRMTARQSRVSALVEGKIANVKMSGYWEMDFLGAAPTANENQSSSFNPRQRQLWAQAAFNNGWTITGGQTWSLWSSNKKGIETRQEWIPATIDGQYVVGYNFARLATLRLTKNFHNKVWWAVSMENPEMLNPSSLTTPANILGFQNGPTGTAGVAMTSALSTDFMPDFVTKVAFEPGWGHYEVKALMRVFRDKIVANPAATPTPIAGFEDKAFGGGIGANAILPIVAKKADLILQATWGQGIGRYSDSTNIDATFYEDGGIRPLKEQQYLAGLELHPTPKLDWYFYGGDEYVGRAWYIGADGKAYGYGSGLADNSGCGLTYVGTAKCQANFRNIAEGTTGFWYRFYKGPAGTMQFGAQYEFLHKNTWWGGATVATAPAAPKANESMFMTSFRYVLP